MLCYSNIHFSIYNTPALMTLEYFGHTFSSNGSRMFMALCPTSKEECSSFSAIVLKECDIAWLTCYIALIFFGKRSYTRYVNISSCWEPFFFLAGISNAEARQPGKAPNFSVNWTIGDAGLEVINATTGKDEMGRASRLCKHALYSRWMRAYAKVYFGKWVIRHHICINRA